MVEIENLSELREKYKDKKIVFCSGSFDLTHAGHVIFFEDCKNLGDILVVSVGSDALIKARKGESRPILDEHIRLKMIDSLRVVDYTLIEPLSDNENTLIGLETNLGNLKPDIYVINEDASDIEYRKSLCERFGIKLVIFKRHCPKDFDDISTTKIIKKIKSLN